MPYNDYIILIDENGSPYIAHGKGWNTWKNRIIKYKDKIPLGNGKFRYIYDETKEKVRATGQRVKKSAEDKIGITAKREADAAWSKVQGRRIDFSNPEDRKLHNAARSALDKYQKTPLGKVEYLGARAYEIASGQDGSARDIVKRALEKRAERRKKKKTKKTLSTLPSQGSSKGGLDKMKAPTMVNSKQ